jgi:hypothetical protein
LELFCLYLYLIYKKRRATTMATRKSIWIMIGVLIIAAWALGSVTQAGAQTYTLKCRNTGYYPKMHIIEVGDVPGHTLYAGEIAGVQSCDDGSVATTSFKMKGEATKGGSKTQLYGLVTFEDGSTYWTKEENTGRVDPTGKSLRFEGMFEIIKGTGRFEGIQGSGTYTGKRLVAPVPGAGNQYYADFTATYTLPSK